MVSLFTTAVLYGFTKFEADSSLCSKVIRGFQNFEIGPRDPSQVDYGSFYGPYATGVRPLCLYQIWSGYLYLFKSCKGPKISKLGHVTVSHAPFQPETLNLYRNPSKHTYAKFYASSLIHRWIIDKSNVKMGHFNDKIGNAHAPCHVTGW